MRPIPQVLLPTWGPRSARPTLGSQLPRLSSRREKREGKWQGCACVLLLPPLPSAGPFPSRQETSPDSQPAAALPPPHPSASSPDPRSHTAQGGRPARSSAPLLGASPRRPGSSRGRPSSQAPPSSRPPGLAPHSPTLARDGVLLGDPTRGPSPPSSLASESEEARDSGTRVKGPLFWAGCGRGAGRGGGRGGRAWNPGRRERVGAGPPRLTLPGPAVKER